MRIWVEAESSMFDAVDPETNVAYVLLEPGTLTCSACHAAIGPHVCEACGEHLVWHPFWFRTDHPVFRLCEDCTLNAEEGW